MTNTAINIKLEAIQDKIRFLIEDIEDEIEALEDKKTALEDKASERASGEMTEREEYRYEVLDARIDALQYLIDNVLGIDIEDEYLEEE